MEQAEIIKKIKALSEDDMAILLNAFANDSSRIPMWYDIECLDIMREEYPYADFRVNESDDLFYMDKHGRFVSDSVNGYVYKYFDMNKILWWINTYDDFVNECEAGYLFTRSQSNIGIPMFPSF